MEIMKFVLLGLAAALMAVLIRGQRPEIAVLLSLAACGLLLTLALGQIGKILEFIQGIAENYDLNITYIGIAVKIAGMACLCDLGVQICRDVGENAIASKVELGGKLLILVLSLPVIQELIQVIGTLML